MPTHGVQLNPECPRAGPLSSFLSLPGKVTRCIDCLTSASAEGPPPAPLHPGLPRALPCICAHESLSKLIYTDAKTKSTENPPCIFPVSSRPTLSLKHLQPPATPGHRRARAVLTPSLTPCWPAPEPAVLGRYAAPLPQYHSTWVESRGFPRDPPTGCAPVPRILGRLEKKTHQLPPLLHSAVLANHHWAATGGPRTRILNWREQGDSGRTFWKRRLAAPPC